MNRKLRMYMLSLPIGILVAAILIAMTLCISGGSIIKMVACQAIVMVITCIAIKYGAMSVFVNRMKLLPVKQRIWDIVGIIFFVVITTVIVVLLAIFMNRLLEVIRDMKGPVVADMWSLHDAGKIVCVLTCGSVTGGNVRNNISSPRKLVMGRGTALDAASRYPDLPTMLASSIQYVGGNSVPSVVWDPTTSLYFFPTKYLWHQPSSIELIKVSCGELMTAMSRNKHTEVYLPMPGCGNGKLRWESVKNAIKDLLDDRVVVVTDMSNPLQT